MIEVELLDATSRSDSVQSSLRHSTGLTWELRKDSVYAISDLARAANRLAIEGAIRQINTRGGDYYEHPLLVDPPFAVIHIAFSKTCEILMEWRNQLLFKTRPTNLEVRQSRGVRTRHILLVYWNDWAIVSMRLTC